MHCSDKQPLKVLPSIVFTLLGMSMLCSDEQPLKALPSIVVTLFGILYTSIFPP